MTDQQPGSIRVRLEQLTREAEIEYAEGSPSTMGAILLSLAQRVARAAAKDERERLFRIELAHPGTVAALARGSKEIRADADRCMNAEEHSRKGRSRER